MPVDRSLHISRLFKYWKHLNSLLGVLSDERVERIPLRRIVYSAIQWIDYSGMQW